MAKDPYQELGVARSASPDEVRKAFRKLAKEFHPDKNQGDKAAEERFKRVSAAFDLIGDPEKRKKFDRGEIDADGHETMRGGFGGFGGGGGAGGFGGGPQYRQNGFEGAQFEGVDLNEILGEMFGERMGKRGKGFRPGAFNNGKGQNIKASLEIDLEEAVRGARKRISFSDGRVIDVTIPAGAADGQVMRLKGQGGPGKTQPGDALITLVIRPHPVFQREGDLLVMDLPVSVPDAVLGGKVEAPTPDGPVTLTVPKGSNSGSTLRLKGRGLPDPASGVRGDLLARLVVVLPDAADPVVERLAEAWRRESPYSPRRR